MSEAMTGALAERVAGLSPGEPLVVTPVPAEILDGVRKALEGGETHYTDRPGVRELRERVARKLGYEPDEVVITNGESEGRFVARLALGDGAEDRVEVGSFDELSGMSSFRVGYVAAKEDDAKKVKGMKQALSICTAAPSQRAVILSLGADE